MTEQEESLLKVLSAMLPYDVVLHYDSKVEQDDEPLYGIRRNGNRYLINDAYYLNEVKPYLRPMSSMTEKEKKELFELCVCVESEDWEGKKTEYYAAEIAERYDPVHFRNDFSFYPDSRAFDWLYAHHFDYRDLIERGMAIAVTESNNPYK